MEALRKQYPETKYIESSWGVFPPLHQLLLGCSWSQRQSPPLRSRHTLQTVATAAAQCCQVNLPNMTQEALDGFTFFFLPSPQTLSFLDFCFRSATTGSFSFSALYVCLSVHVLSIFIFSRWHLISSLHSLPIPRPWSAIYDDRYVLKWASEAATRWW